MPELGRLCLVWAAVLAAGALGALALGPYGANVFALGLLYAALATSWSWMRATGLFSLGHAAFFGSGALAQAGLVASARVPFWLALALSAAVGALVVVPLIPALRLAPASFGLATLAYAMLLRGVAGNVPAVGHQGFLLPATPGFQGTEPALLAALAALAVSLSLGYQVFLGLPGGHVATAIRQAPETAQSLGIDYVQQRWRPLVLNGAATAVAGAFYAHVVGSVDPVVVFSPVFSALPLILGMLGGALNPLGGMVGTLAVYPLDEVLLRPALPQAHVLFYGLTLVALAVLRPGGLLRARIPRIGVVPSALKSTPRIPHVLVARRLTVRRNGSQVLRDVTVAVEPGKTLRVVGPNGAGKSSLLLALAGAVPAAAGAILLDGTAAPRRPAERARRGLARTFQVPQPFPDWTVRENMAIAAERSGSLDQVDRLLHDLELTPFRDRPAGQLSVGEGKRLELARALCLRPVILLLDEPLAGLSPQAAATVSRTIQRAKDEGAAIAWVEHGSLADGMADQLLVLDGGRVRYYGAPSDWEAVRRALPG